MHVDRSEAGERTPERRTEYAGLTALTVRRFRRHRLAVAALIVITLLILGSALADLSPYDPEGFAIEARNKPPSVAHPMGTDEVGRDVLTRALYGGRVSLTVGLVAAALAVLIGTVVGAFSGYYGGLLDRGLMRLTDAFLAFPALFVLIVLGAFLRDSPLAGLRNQAWLVAVAIGVISWMGVARVVRSTFLALRETDFVEAARAAGASNRRIMVYHILPNAVGPIIVHGTLLVAYAIIAESGLSYLGFGVQPPTPSWGNMLGGAQTYMARYPWLAVFPGLMVLLSVLSMNYVGDGLRDALDPHQVR
jgi:peptide/nickel transport system permease protein